MAFSEHTQYLAPNLTLPLAGHTYHVPPPTKEDGLILTSFVALAVNTANGQQSTPADLERLNSSAERSLAELSLTSDVYEQMLADKVPGVHIDQAAIYAMYYWTMGEKAADEVFRLMYADSVEGTLPKGLTTLKIGPSTVSENPTKTASTPATESHPATSDHQPPTRRKKATSRGVTPSTTGVPSSQTSPNTTD